MIATEITTLMAVRELIARVLEVDDELVSSDTDLTLDLGADSIDRLELAIALEEMFGVSLSDDQIRRMQTVSETASMLGEVDRGDLTSG